MARVEQRRFVQHWRAAGKALSWRTRTTIPVASCVFAGLYSFSRGHSQNAHSFTEQQSSSAFAGAESLLGLRCNLGVIAVQAFLALIFNCETGPQRLYRHLCRRGRTLFRGGIHKPIETIKTFILFRQKNGNLRLFSLEQKPVWALALSWRHSNPTVLCSDLRCQDSLAVSVAGLAPRRKSGEAFQ
jgi:hypothetical protein